LDKGTGDFTHPFPHTRAFGEKASTVTRVPLEALLRVDKAITVTVLTDLARVKTTARRIVRPEYWSTMRDRFPLTKTAARPFLGPAVNHIANDLPFTVNDKAAPVDVVAHTDRP
jgi:hypothetical protein